MHSAWYLKKNAVLLCQWQWFSVVYHLACMRNLKMSVKLWVNFRFSQYMLIVLLSLNMSQKKRKMKHTFCAGGSRWRLPLCEESDGCWTLMTVGKRLPSVLHYCRQSRLELMLMSSTYTTFITWCCGLCSNQWLSPATFLLCPVKEASLGVKIIL